MDPAIQDLQARALMLEHVTMLAWGNIIRNLGQPGAMDSVEVAALNLLRASRDDAGAGPLGDLYDAVIEHEEAFWKMVRGQLESGRSGPTD